MSDQPPRWGEPGYVPPPSPPGWGEPGYVPPPKPPKPPVPLRPGQRRVLWFALALAVVGQLVYWVGILWGTADCYQIFGHPGVAIAGFVISVGAVPLVVPFVRLWSRASLPTFAIVVTLLVAMNPAWEVLLMLGGACW